jgi:hypothetical protein
MTSVRFNEEVARFFTYGARELRRRRRQAVVVTLDGRVVGIDVAGSTQAENIGFAVAIDAAKPLLTHALNA